MPNFSQITICGHAGRDVEVRNVGDSQVAETSIAVTKKYKDKESTSWFKVSVWGKRADAFAQYVHKGDAVMVVGEPTIEEYTDKNGAAKTAVKVRVSDFVLIGGRKDKQSSQIDMAACIPTGSLADEVGAKVKAATGEDAIPF